MKKPHKLSVDEAHLLHSYLFDAALSKMLDKRVDYSGTVEPFKNFYESGEFAEVIPWKGAMTRLGDKFSRFKQLAKNGGVGKVKDESIVDTIVDSLNYPPIMLMLWMEAVQPKMIDRLLRQAKRAEQKKRRGKRAKTSHLVRR